MNSAAVGGCQNNNKGKKMKKFLMSLAAGSLALAVGFSAAIAQEEEEQSDPATPIELFACTYNEGQGPADLDAVVASFNDWADDHDVNDYSAWTLVPYYSSPEQEFDWLWLGGSPSAKVLGSLQDTWLAEGGKVQAEFDEVADCNVHANFAVLQFKKPAERADPDHIVVSFSDCNIADGVTFDDVAPALTAWADYRTGTGSTAGLYVFFPAYGGGGEEYDFKFVASYGNLAEQGADWDEYSAGGYAKAAELFDDKLDCDSSRVYLTTNRRMAADDDE